MIRRVPALFGAKQTGLCFIRANKMLVQTVRICLMILINRYKLVHLSL